MCNHNCHGQNIEVHEDIQHALRETHVPDAEAIGIMIIALGVPAFLVVCFVVSLFT